MSRHWTDGREGHDPGTWDECRKCAADRTPLRAALERLTSHHEHVSGPFVIHGPAWTHKETEAASCFICAALATDTQDGAVDLDVERLTRAIRTMLNGDVYVDDDTRHDFGDLIVPLTRASEAASLIAAAYAATPPPQPGERA